MQLVAVKDEKFEVVALHERERVDMQIDTLAFNTPSGREISLNEVDSSQLEQYFLSKDQSRLKETIWMTQNADYLQRQK
jgi:hypothetical protein